MRLTNKFLAERIISNALKGRLNFVLHCLEGINPFMAHILGQMLADVQSVRLAEAEDGRLCVEIKTYLRTMTITDTLGILVN